jgi:predicted peroxiredoxin
MAERYLLIITHAKDDEDRANAAFGFAAALVSEGHEVTVFFLFEGANLARSGVAETIAGRHYAPVRDLLPILTEADVPFMVCGACAKTYGIEERELIDRCQIVQIPTVAGLMAGRQTLTF